MEYTALKLLPPSLKEILLSELDFVIERIHQESLIRRKLYFFSGIFAAVERVMRISYDSQLVLLHMALSICHNNILSLVSNRERGDVAVEIPANISETLEALLSELRDRIQKNDDLYVTVDKIVSFAYLCTGGGYYSSLYTQYLASKIKK